MNSENIAPMNGRDRILALLAGEPVDRPPLMPITMMYAVDRIGKTYNEYATDHRVLVEAQMNIADEFDFDYVTVISDPGREASDCGATIEYFDDQPPAVDEANARLVDKKELLTLKIPDPFCGGRMQDRIEAVALFRRKVGGEKAIEGWVEGPMAEAADLRGINRIMLDFYEDPGFIRDLFEFILDMELQFAKAQIEAGADHIGIGDAAASLVGPKFYREFIWPMEKRLVEGIVAMGGKTRLHICGNIRHHLEGVGKLGCDIVDLDWMVPVAEAREKTGPNQVLLGNIDPVAVLKNGTPETVHAGLEQCYQEAAGNFVVAAGCEVPRGTPDENVRAMTEFVKSHGG